MDCVRSNKGEFFSYLSPVLENFTNVQAIAKESGINDKVLKQCKEDIAQTQESAILLKEKLNKLCLMQDSRFG